MEQKQYKYSAFISYKHLDKCHAVWLQKRLEHYRLPAKLCAQHKLPKKLDPCFRDVTDLTGGVLENAILNEMKQCKYMIVICSQNMYNSSKYIDFEVEAFRKLHGAENIIPFIVGGEIGQDKTKNPFPNAIKESQTEYLGINIAQDGKKIAVLKVIAKILGLSADDLIEREKARQKKRVALLSSVSVALFCAIFATWLYVKPYQNNYLDYVLVYNQPQGIYPITNAEAKAEDGYYIITTQMGKTMAIEYVNSYGTLLDNSSDIKGDRPSKAIYTYTGGQLSMVSYFNQYDIALYTMQFVGDSLEKALFYDSVNPSDPYRLSASIDDAFEEMADLISEQPQSNITGYLYTYDENGFTQTQLFIRNSEEYPACTDELIFGYEFAYDEQGRVAAKTYLNAEHEYMGDTSGVAYTMYEYEGTAIAAVSYYDTDMQPIQGTLDFARAEISYAENIQTTIFYNVAGEISISSYYGFAMQEILYDAYGNEVSFYFYDESGALLDGLAYAKHSYDENGRVILAEYYDKDGSFTPVNYFEIRAYTYYENGIMQTMVLYNPSDGAYAEIHYGYDEDWNKTSESLYDSSGALHVFEEYNFYYATEEIVYENGKPLQISYRDENGELMINRLEGYAVMAVEYDNTASNPVKFTYYDENYQITNLQHFVFTLEERLENLEKSGSTLLEMEGIEQFLEEMMQEELASGWDIATAEVRYTNGMISYIAYYDALGQKSADPELGYYCIDIKMDYTTNAKLETYTRYYDETDTLVTESYSLEHYNGAVEFFCYTLFENGKAVDGYQNSYGTDGTILMTEGISYNEYGDKTVISTQLYDEDGEKTSFYMIVENEDGEQVKGSTYSTYYDNKSVATYVYTEETLDGVLITELVRTYYPLDSISVYSGSTGELQSLVQTNYENGNKSFGSALYYDESGTLISSVSITYGENDIITVQTELVSATQTTPEQYIRKEYDEDGALQVEANITTYTDGTKEMQISNYAEGVLLQQITTYYDTEGNAIDKQGE